MARITVEDCLNKENNRFELVLTASERARQLAYGAESTLSWDKDKPTVMALREIAAGHVNADGSLKSQQAPAQDLAADDQHAQ